MIKTSAGGNMGYRLIAFDIDDTLLPPTKQLSKANKNAIKRAIDEGVYVTLATGRGYLGSKPVIDELMIDGAVINYGGAMINDAKSGKHLHAAYIPWETAKEILTFAYEKKIHAHIYQEDGLVYESYSRYPVEYCRKLKIPGVLDASLRKKQWENIPKVLFMTDEKTVMEILPAVMQLFADKAEVALSSPGFIEFNCKGTHKGSALAWLADYLSIPREEVIAVGDNTLDREMLEWAGLGIAVKNASPAVLNIADAIAPASNESAAEWIIRKYIFGGSLEL